jgi:hypothetical protein
MVLVILNAEYSYNMGINTYAVWFSKIGFFFFGARSISYHGSVLWFVGVYEVFDI